MSTPDYELSAYFKLLCLKALVSMLMALALFYLFLSAMFPKEFDAAKAAKAAKAFRYFMRNIIPKGFGAAGALSWALTGLIEVGKLFVDGISIASDYLFIATATIGLIVFIAHNCAKPSEEDLKNSKEKLKYPKEGSILWYLDQLRIFLLKVCGPAGGTYFLLTWIALVLITINPVVFAAPAIGVLLAISAVVALTAFYLVYFTRTEDHATLKQIICFISRVPGTGGATHWFLAFLMFTGVSISTPILIAIPAVMMLIAGVIWYLDHYHIKNTVELTDVKSGVTKPCFSCYPELIQAPTQKEDKAGLLEESAIPYPGA